MTGHVMFDFVNRSDKAAEESTFAPPQLVLTI